jgi:UDP-glucose 4-epimerase
MAKFQVIIGRAEEVIAGVEAITGKPVPHKFEARRPGDPAHLVANSDKAKAILGWQPKHDLKSIIQSAANWEANRRY